MASSKSDSPHESSRRSIWNAVEQRRQFPRLESELSVDVAVVGGGITGVTTAALLAREGKRVAVLEAMSVGLGTTGHSTGNLYAPVDERIDRLSKTWGDERLSAVLRSRSSAIDLIESYVQQHGIDCAFSREPWVLFTTETSREAREEIEKEYEAAVCNGLVARLVDALPFPSKVEKALIIERQAQFHPRCSIDTTARQRYRRRLRKVGRPRMTRLSS